MRAAALLLGLAACAAPMNHDPSWWRVSAVKAEGRGGVAALRPTVHPVEGMGDAGPLDPAVIEYVLTAPGSPVRVYFEAWLAEGGDRGTSSGVTVLRDRVTALVPAGATPSAADYARAWAAPVTGPVRDRIAGLGGASYPGVALVRCCATVDPLGPRLAREPEARGDLTLLVVRNHAARHVMLVWRDRLRGGTLTWDASALPAAFEDGAALDGVTVAAALVPLHVEAAP